MLWPVMLFQVAVILANASSKRWDSTATIAPAVPAIWLNVMEAVSFSLSMFPVRYASKTISPMIDAAIRTKGCIAITALSAACAAVTILSCPARAPLLFATIPMVLPRSRQPETATFTVMAVMISPAIATAAIPAALAMS